LSSVYLETSVLLRILFAQGDYSKILSRIRKARHVVTSRLTRIEAERALIRHCIENESIQKERFAFERDLRQLWTSVDFIEIDESVCELAGRLSPASRVRSLDAIHLATFQLLRQRSPDLEMLSCDERIARES
jgi:predicted nucleic acid-binding protein